jgi:hypothetical protein
MASVRKLFVVVDVECRRDSGEALNAEIMASLAAGYAQRPLFILGPCPEGSKSIHGTVHL